MTDNNNTKSEKHEQKRSRAGAVELRRRNPAPAFPRKRAFFPRERRRESADFFAAHDFAEREVKV